VRLVGQITKVVDSVFDAIHAEITTDDGKPYTFGVLDSRVPPEEWIIGMRVTFEEGVIPGQAKYVKLLDADPAHGKTVVIVAVEGVTYSPRRADGHYLDGVEVAYSYWVADGWRNYSMETIPWTLSGDLLNGVGATGHTDYGRSPNISVHHPVAGLERRAYDTPVMICDGRWHSATAIIGFGQGEQVAPGAEVSVRITLRVTTGRSGNGVLAEASAERNLTIAERSTPRHSSDAASDIRNLDDKSIDDWASTEPS